MGTTSFIGTCILIMIWAGPVCAQDDLLSLLESETVDSSAVVLAEATFKGSRVINGHSIELRHKGVLEFLISHRFGRINEGAKELFGLDDSNIRLGLEFGLTKDLVAGIGRSSFEKQVDGYLKYRILRQQSGARNLPVTAVFFTSMAINTLPNLPDQSLDFTNRTNYTFQLLIARKFSPGFSLQVAPTVVHKNLVVNAGDANDLFVTGVGARQKITNRLSFNAEYFYFINKPQGQGLQDALAIGFDIETGGHVFQLHLTNSRAMIEKGFLTETNGDFFDGDIHFGFNISRVFNLSSQKSEDW